jgi:hypothetical protein
LSIVIKAHQSSATRTRDNDRDWPLGRDQPATICGGAGPSLLEHDRGQNEGASQDRSAAPEPATSDT